MPVRTKHDEEPARYYDKCEYHQPYDTARFLDVYATVRKYIRDFPDPWILEAGCGIGTLAQMLVHEDGYTYRGFDFSKKALEQAPITIQKHLSMGNAYSEINYSEFFDILVAVEVFEHLDDHQILGFVPAGKRVVFSVPNYSSRGHVRYFKDEVDIVGYYSQLSIREITQIPTNEEKVIFVCDSIKLP